MSRNSVLEEFRVNKLAKKATVSNEFFVKFRPFRQIRNELNMFNSFRLCRKNCLTCSIRQCCFDIVAGVDGAIERSSLLETYYTENEYVQNDYPFVCVYVCLCHTQRY